MLVQLISRGKTPGPRKGDLEPGNQTDSGPNSSSGPATSHGLNVFIHEMGILTQTTPKGLMELHMHI